MAEHSEQYEGWTDLPEEAPKPSYSKVIVAVCVTLVLVFTVACMTFYWFGKSVDQVLIGFFFACFGIEFASLAFIKGRKIRYVGGNAANRQMGHVEGEKDE